MIISNNNTERHSIDWSCPKTYFLNLSLYCTCCEYWKNEQVSDFRRNRLDLSVLKICSIFAQNEQSQSHISCEVWRVQIARSTKQLCNDWVIFFLEITLKSNNGMCTLMMKEIKVNLTWTGQKTLNLRNDGQKRCLSSWCPSCFQVQATVVGFLASIAAVIFGWIPEGNFNMGHAVLLCASSVATAFIASLLLGERLSHLLYLWVEEPDTV